jgi:hypothetical protein
MSSVPSRDSGEVMRRFNAMRDEFLGLCAEIAGMVPETSETEGLIAEPEAEADVAVVAEQTNVSRGDGYRLSPAPLDGTDHLLDMGVRGVRFRGAVVDERNCIHLARHSQIEARRAFLERVQAQMINSASRRHTGDGVEIPSRAKADTYVQIDVPRRYTSLEDVQRMISSRHWARYKCDRRLGTDGNLHYNLKYYCKHGGRSLARNDNAYGERKFKKPSNQEYRCPAKLKVIFITGVNAVTVFSNSFEHHGHARDRIVFSSNLADELKSNMAAWRRASTQRIANADIDEAEARTQMEYIDEIESDLEGMFSQVQDLVYRLSVDSSITYQRELQRRLGSLLDFKVRLRLDDNPNRSRETFRMLYTDAAIRLLPKISRHMYSFIRNVRGECSPPTVGEIDSMLLRDREEIQRLLRRELALPPEIILGQTGPIMIGYSKRLSEDGLRIESHACTLSTPALLKLAMDCLGQTFYFDGTYKLSTSGCGLLVVGCCDRTRKFFPVAYSIATSESEYCISSMFEHITDALARIFYHKWEPEMFMADGCLGLDCAIKNCFEGFDLMRGRGSCYYHAKERMRTNHYKPSITMDSTTTPISPDDLLRISSEWQSEFLADIEFVGLSHARPEFEVRVSKFVSKWLPRNPVGINQLVSPGSYLDLSSPSSNWFAGFGPPGVGRTNNVVESHNRLIKEHVTRYKILPHVRLIKHLYSQDSLLASFSADAVNHFRMREEHPTHSSFRAYWREIEDVVHNPDHQVVLPTGDWAQTNRYIVPQLLDSRSIRSLPISLPDESLQDFDEYARYWRRHCIVTTSGDRSSITYLSRSGISCSCKSYLLKSACCHIFLAGLIEGRLGWPVRMVISGARDARLGATNPPTIQPGEGLRRIERVPRVRSSRIRRGRPKKVQKIVISDNVVSSESSNTLRMPHPDITPVVPIVPTEEDGSSVQVPPLRRSGRKRPRKTETE